MIVADITQQLIGVINGYILCFESAAMENLLISAPIGVLTTYRLDSDISLASANLEVYVNELSNSTDDCVKLRDGLWCTNTERTICELIRFGRYDGYVYEALENYEGNLEFLRDYAKKYNVDEELQNYIASM